MPKTKSFAYFPLIISVIQWPNFDELSILIVKHNPLAVCLQETFLKDTDNSTVGDLTSIINSSNTRLHQSANADVNNPIYFCTSILKDTAEETIRKTSAVPKRFNKPWFSDICKDAIKECNRALEMFKRESTEGNLKTYRIARAKARRDIRHTKKTSWRNYVSNMNSQTSVKSVWNRIRKSKGKDTSNAVHNLPVSDRDVTSHRDIANALADIFSH